METVAAQRLVRPSWRDPRLGIGVILVAASVALGTWAVGAASATESVWSASRTLTPGESLAGNVVAVEVTPALADLYLAASMEPTGVVDRTVEVGELVPLAAVVDSGEVGLRSIVVPSGSRLAAGVTDGAVVDVWLTPRGRQGEAPGEPFVVVSGALVSAVTLEQSAWSASEFGSVELLVEDTALQGVISAMADGGALVVVPRP